jgi:hypothetical protein
MSQVDRTTKKKKVHITGNQRLLQVDGAAGSIWPQVK